MMQVVRIMQSNEDGEDDEGDKDSNEQLLCIDKASTKLRVIKGYDKAS